MLKVLSSILCDLDPKVKVIGQKAGICDGLPSTSALVETNFVVPVTILAASIWIFLYLVFLAECNYPKQHLRIQVMA